MKSIQRIQKKKKKTRKYFQHFIGKYYVTRFQSLFTNTHAHIHRQTAIKRNSHVCSSRRLKQNKNFLLLIEEKKQTKKKKKKEKRKHLYRFIYHHLPGTSFVLLPFRFRELKI